MARHRAVTETMQLFNNFILGILVGYVVTSILLTEVPGQEPGVGYYYDTHSHDIGNEDLQRSHGDVAVLAEDALRNWLWPRVRILCWVMTAPGRLHNITTHVKATWARRCNIVLYMSSQNNTDFPTVAVADQEGRRYLWQKTSGAFEYIHKHYLDKADWFLKADDDTFVIVENLRKLLSAHDPDKAVYFGRKFIVRSVPVIYMQGGAGYVLSRKAVEVLVEQIFKTERFARMKKNKPNEDIMIGTLFREAGVPDGYSRDGNHETFHALAPEETIVPRRHVYTLFNFYPYKQGPECCSNYTITFHHVTPDNMYWLEYMVYHLRPFGVGHYLCPANISSIIGLPEVTTAERSKPPQGMWHFTRILLQKMVFSHQ